MVPYWRQVILVSSSIEDDRHFLAFGKDCSKSGCKAPEGNEAFLSYESVWWSQASACKLSSHPSPNCLISCARKPRLSSDTTGDGTLVVTSQMPGVKPPKEGKGASGAAVWSDCSGFCWRTQ